MIEKFIDFECSTCVFFDSGFCMKYKDQVDPHSSCNEYEQDEEPEPYRVRNKKKKHRESEDNE